MKKIIVYFLAILFLLIGLFFIRRYFVQSPKKNLINEVINFPIILENETKIINISQLNDKLLLLYFWDSEISDMDISKFQKLINIGMKENQVEIFSINCGLEDENSSISKMSIVLDNNKDILSTFSLNKNNNLLRNLKINCFPTTVIINREGNIVFRGPNDLAADMILIMTYSL